MIDKIKYFLNLAKEKVAQYSPLFLFVGIFGVALFASCHLVTGCVHVLNQASPSIQGQKQHSKTVKQINCQECQRMCADRTLIRTTRASFYPKLQTAQCWDGE